MIRKITIDDFDKWKRLRLEAVKLHPEAFGESYEGVKKQDKKWFEESLKNSVTFTYLQDNKMIGLIGIFSMQPENMRHRASLFGLYVKADHRGKGIAGALVEQVLNYVKPNHKQLHLTVTTTNQVAISLYKKHGFVIYGTEPDALLIGDKYYDEYLMLKKL
jgi:ribosomal protein S18 acetylase RimI-like enzyme